MPLFLILYNKEKSCSIVYFSFLIIDLIVLTHVRPSINNGELLMLEFFYCFQILQDYSFSNFGTF